MRSATWAEAFSPLDLAGLIVVLAIVVWWLAAVAQEWREVARQRTRMRRRLFEVIHADEDRIRRETERTVARLADRVPPAQSLRAVAGLSTRARGVHRFREAASGVAINKGDR